MALSELPAVIGELIDQPSRKPTLKLTASAAGAVATAVVLYVAGKAGLKLTAEEGEGVVIVAGFLAGYLKREKAVAAVVTRVQHVLTPAVHAAEAAVPGLSKTVDEVVEELTHVDQAQFAAGGVVSARSDAPNS